MLLALVNLPVIWNTFKYLLCPGRNVFFFKTARLVKCALLNVCGSCMQCIFYLKIEIWGKIFQRKCKCKASVLCIFAVGAMCCASSDQSNYTISTAILTLVNSETWAFCLCMFPQHYQLHIVSHRRSELSICYCPSYCDFSLFQQDKTALDTLLCFSHWILNNVRCLHSVIVWTDWMTDKMIY